MRVLETDCWSLLLPPEWVAERDDDGVVISDRDGVGCLEISVLLGDGPPADAAIVAELSAAPVALEATSLAGYPCFTAAFEEDGAALREWWIAAPGVLLYITYSCDGDNRGLDDAAVDDMLSTLRIALEDGGAS